MKKIIYFIIIFVSIFVLSNRINAWSKYEIGQEVEYNGIKFYVIKDSDSSEETVTMIKDDALKSSEMIDYLSSTEIIDKTVDGDFKVLNFSSEYLKVSYYMESNCKTGGNNIGCSIDYSVSDIKQVIDVWANNYINMNDLTKDSTGYKVRLITYDELTNDLGIQINVVDPTNIQTVKTKDISNWFFKDYSFWTMSQLQDFNNELWIADSQKIYVGVVYDLKCVRPVITIYKTALGDTNEQEEINKDDKNNTSDNNSKKESKVAVNVPNTLEKISIIFIMIGIVIISIGIIIVVKNKDIIRKK